MAAPNAEELERHEAENSREQLKEKIIRAINKKFSEQIGKKSNSSQGIYENKTYATDSLSEAVKYIYINSLSRLAASMNLTNEQVGKLINSLRAVKEEESNKV